MNLYTRIWLKLAPKDWRGVSTDYLRNKEDQLIELSRQRDALWRIIQDLRKGYGRLASIIATTAEEVPQNAGEAFTCT